MRAAGPQPGEASRRPTCGSGGLGRGPCPGPASPGKRTWNRSAVLKPASSGEFSGSSVERLLFQWVPPGPRWPGARSHRPQGTAGAGASLVRLGSGAVLRKPRPVSGEVAGWPQTQTGALCVFWFGRWTPAGAFLLFLSRLSSPSVLVPFFLPKLVFLGLTSPLEGSHFQGAAVGREGPWLGDLVWAPPCGSLPSKVCPSCLTFLLSGRSRKLGKDGGCGRPGDGGSHDCGAGRPGSRGPRPSSSFSLRLQSWLENGLVQRLWVLYYQGSLLEVLLLLGGWHCCWRFYCFFGVRDTVFPQQSLTLPLGGVGFCSFRALARHRPGW